jgi:hypothetical protein
MTSPRTGTFLRSERTGMLEKTGRWDESLDLCREILDRAAPAPITRLCPSTRAGTLLARRGEATAWEYLDQAMTDAAGTGEPQSIVPARLARAEACWLEGRAADAISEVEWADEAADTGDAWLYGSVAVWLRRTGSARRPRGELAEPYQHQVNGHWEKATRLWTDLDCPYEAALARLDAAEEGALRTALSTFTELGATAVARLARQKLRALGARSIPVGPRSATRDDPLGLKATSVTPAPPAPDRKAWMPLMLLHRKCRLAARPRMGRHADANRASATTAPSVTYSRPSYVDLGMLAPRRRPWRAPETDFRHAALASTGPILLGCRVHAAGAT